jgi:hypothetical protein
VFKFPTAGGPILRLLGPRYIMLGLKQSMKRGDTMFYFHSIDICGESFPLTSSLTQRLFWVFSGYNTEKRIRKILSCFCQVSGACCKLLKNRGDLNGYQNI